MNPIVAGALAGVGLAGLRAAAVWALMFWPRPPRQPMRDLRVSSDAPTMIASEARKARGIQ